MKQSKHPHPYSQPFHQWPPDVLAAYQTFPKLNGMNAPVTPATEKMWGEWARKTDRKYWPRYFLEYIDEKKRQKDKYATQGE